MVSARTRRQPHTPKTRRAAELALAAVQVVAPLEEVAATPAHTQDAPAVDWAGTKPPASASPDALRPAGVDLKDPALYLNRELSWLEFNRRVLDEAYDHRHPLLERVKFLAIFSTNLDEFFMIRVSGLKDQMAAGVTTAPPDGITPAQTLAAIRERVPAHAARSAALLLLGDPARAGRRGDRPLSLRPAHAGGA